MGNETSPESVMAFEAMMAVDWPGIELGFDGGTRQYSDSRAEGLWKVWCRAMVHAQSSALAEHDALLKWAARAKAHGEEAE